MVPDYSSRAKVVIKVLIRGRQESKSQTEDGSMEAGRQRERDLKILYIAGFGDGTAMSQRLQTACGSWDGFFPSVQREPSLLIPWF